MIGVGCTWCASALLKDLAAKDLRDKEEEAKRLKALAEKAVQEEKVRKVGIWYEDRCLLLSIANIGMRTASLSICMISFLLLG